MTKPRIILKLESTIERSFEKYVKSRGFFSIKIVKRGWPDRMIQLSNNYNFYIEFKRLDGESGKLQRHIHKTLRDIGCHVYVCNDLNISKSIFEYELAWSIKNVKKVKEFEIIK